MLPENAPKPDHSVGELLVSYKATEGAARYFCKMCGAHLFFQRFETEAWQIATGVLEKVDGFVTFERHIYVEDTVDGGFSDWLPTITDRPLERWAMESSDNDEPLLGGYASKRPEISKVNKAQGKLHAHCQCGGVEMYIARPSARSSDITASWPDVLHHFDTGDASMHENETWWLRANKQKFLGGCCTCDSCRLAVGFEAIQWAFIPVNDISLDAEGKEPFTPDFGTLRMYRSSEGTRRRFCGTCGATVFWESDTRPDLIDVAVGLLDAPEGARAEQWLEWTTERVSFREDAVERAEELVSWLEKGLAEWGKKVQDREGPPEEVKKQQQRWRNGKEKS
ncbi:hypothetical protein LTR50_000662 [Elasticomyces elasticus]|nr:hypothetical protein LTR50_000662 [Elasticomyces elasticus]